MSGHSKWSTIKRQKGVADAKRGQQFTKLSNAITIAAKEGGGSPDSNFKLRLAIEVAREANMPKDNITRAIDRGTGKLQSGVLEELTYEAYGPSGVALMIQTVTDNRQRTGSLIRSIVDRSGGSMGSVGSVAWMFTPVGEIEVKLVGNNSEAIMLAAVDLGAEDIEEVGSSVLLYTSVEKLESLKNDLKQAGFEVANAELIQKQKSSVRIEDTSKAKQILDLVDKLEELDDVQKVYANFDIDESILQSVVF